MFQRCIKVSKKPNRPWGTIIYHPKSEIREQNIMILDTRYEYVAFWYVKMSMELELKLDSHLCHFSQFLV